jgi:hypothetical protein
MGTGSSALRSALASTVALRLREEQSNGFTGRVALAGISSLHLLVNPHLASSLLSSASFSSRGAGYGWNSVWIGTDEMTIILAYFSAATVGDRCGNGKRHAKLPGKRFCSSLAEMVWE